MGRAMADHVDQAGDIDAHVDGRDMLKSGKSPLQEIVSCCCLVQKMFEIGRGKLNECLEKVSLFGVVTCGMPEPLEDFVTFPPVRKIIQVDSVQVVF
jgi:hypothetical protein